MLFSETSCSQGVVGGPLSIQEAKARRQRVCGQLRLQSQTLPCPMVYVYDLSVRSTGFLREEVAWAGAAYACRCGRAHTHTRTHVHTHTHMDTCTQDFDIGVWNITLFCICLCDVCVVYV